MSVLVGVGWLLRWVRARVIVHNLLFNPIDVLLACSHSLDKSVILLLHVHQFLLKLITPELQLLCVIYSFLLTLLSPYRILLEMLNPLLKLLCFRFVPPILQMNIIHFLNMPLAVLLKLFNHAFDFVLVVFKSRFH